MNDSQPLSFARNTLPADGFQFFIDQVSGPHVFELQGFGGGTETNATVSAGTFSTGTNDDASIVVFDMNESLPAASRLAPSSRALSTELRFSSPLPRFQSRLRRP